MVSDKQRMFIEKKIRDLVQSHEVSDSKKIAVDYNALLLHSDMGGAYCLNCNGQIFSIMWDAPKKVKYENDKRILNLVLFQGSKKFPELAALVPQKTQLDEICPHCDGTGVSKVAQETKLDSIVCYCGGLGWIPGQEIS